MTHTLEQQALDAGVLPADKVAVEFTINAPGYRTVHSRVFVSQRLLAEQPTVALEEAFNVAAMAAHEPELWQP